MIPPSVQPWARCDPRRLRDLGGVLTDIDDTLTTEGAIPMGVVAALAALRAAGLPVVAVTGRPMGWSLPIAAEVPLAAVVAENGAVAAAAARIVREVPGAIPSRDSVGRVTDIAIDHAEFAQLDEARIAQVVAVMRAEGMTATVSSIHVNGWFGTHSKLSGADWIVRRLFSRELAAERERWLYVGDSTNDEAMFASFPLSVGVANLLDFAARLRQWPAFITALDRGRGFVEVAEALLAARGS